MTTEISWRGRWWLIGALGLLAWLPVRAQQVDQPPVPRLAAAPEHSAWVVQYQYKVPDPYPKTTNAYDALVYDKMRKANPRLETVTVIKAGTRRKEVDHYADDSETVKWIVNDLFTSDSRVTHALQTMMAKGADIKFQQDFYELSWIDKADFMGRKKVQDEDCYIYRRGGNNDDKDELAYISVRTGLPRQVEVADAVRTYVFKDSSDNLELPKNVEQRLRDFIATAAPKAY